MNCSIICFKNYLWRYLFNHNIKILQQWKYFYIRALWSNYTESSVMHIIGLVCFDHMIWIDCYNELAFYIATLIWFDPLICIKLIFRTKYKSTKSYIAQERKPFEIRSTFLERVFLPLHILYCNCSKKNCILISIIKYILRRTFRKII